MSPIVSLLCASQVLDLFKKLCKILHQQKAYDLFYCDTCFTVVVWDVTCKISEVCLCSPDKLFSENWGWWMERTHQYFRSHSLVLALATSHLCYYHDLQVISSLPKSPPPDIKLEQLASSGGPHLLMGRTGRGGLKWDRRAWGVTLHCLLSANQERRPAWSSKARSQV